MEASQLAANLQRVRQELAEASGGRYPIPKLIAVTKTHAMEAILPLKALGVTDVGENRVQEIREKMPTLGENFRVHLIGRLQSNKVKYIMETVCMIQSLDRMELAEEIRRQAERHGRVMPVLVQVSPAGEEQKGGIAAGDLRAFLHKLSAMDGLHVRGLMAVLPNLGPCQELEDLFCDMRTLFDHLREEAIPGVDMEELSMGMSGDYLYAARYGATMVRVGSAIFGPR